LYVDDMDIVRPRRSLKIDKGHDGSGKDFDEQFQKELGEGAGQSQN